MLERSEEHDKAVKQLKSQNLRLMKEKQYMTQQIHSMGEELSALQQQQLEVINHNLLCSIKAQS